MLKTKPRPRGPAHYGLEAPGECFVLVKVLAFIAIQLYLGIVDTFVALAGLATRLKLPAYGWLVSRAFIFTFAKPTNRFLVGLSTIPRVHYSEVQL